MNERKILYLEADEEIPGVIDRLRQEKSDQITLVIPKSSIILQSVINLRLILRLSKELKKSIALVSHDPIGRNLASQVGIPAYDSVNAKIPVLSPIGPKPTNEDDIAEVEDSLAEADEPFQINHFQAQNEPEEEIDAITTEEIDELKARGNSEKQANSVADRNEFVKTEVEPAALPPKVSTQEKPLPLKKKGKKKKWGYVLAAIAGLIVIVVGFGLFYPKATVAVDVNGQKFDSSAEITADQSQKEASLTGGVIPATYVESVKEKSQKVTATGTKDIGEKASGTIDFYNSYSDNDESLPAGTNLAKDGKTFVTTQDITIPGATASIVGGGVVVNPGHTSGAIVATDSGDSYNVSKGQYTITDMSAAKQSKVYGQSDKALTGGTSKTVTVVSQNDINQAKDSLVSDLEDQAKADLTNQLKGKVLLDKAIDNQVVSADADKAVGDQVDSFNLDVKVKARALGFDSASFRTVFLSKAKSEVPKDKEFLVTDKDEISTSVSNLDIDAKKIVIIGKISTQIGPKIDQAKLKAQLTGKKIAAAKKITAQVDGINAVNIKINPNWTFGYLPISSKQIEIKVNYK